MKIKYLHVLFFLTFTLACDDDEVLEEITYPRTFKLSEASYDSCDAYQITANGYNSLVDLNEIDDIKEVFDTDFLPFFEEISVTLLSDDEIRLTIPSNNPPESIFQYNIEGNNIIVTAGGFPDTLSVSEIGSFSLGVNDNLTEVQMPFQLYLFNSYNDFFQERRWSSINLNTTTFSDTDWNSLEQIEILDLIQEEELLSISDTIILSLGNFLYQAQ